LRHGALVGSHVVEFFGRDQVLAKMPPDRSHAYAIRRPEGGVATDRVGHQHDSAASGRVQSRAPAPPYTGKSRRPPSSPRASSRPSRARTRTFLIQRGDCEPLNSSNLHPPYARSCHPMLEFVGFNAGNYRPLLTQMSEFVTQACGKLSSRRPLRSHWAGGTEPPHRPRAPPRWVPRALGGHLATSPSPTSAQERRSVLRTPPIRSRRLTDGWRLAKHRVPLHICVHSLPIGQPPAHRHAPHAGPPFTLTANSKSPRCVKSVARVSVTRSAAMSKWLATQVKAEQG
jgi:hypothetical protein